MPEPHSYAGGTITVTNGSTAVTGSLTAWASSVLPGDEIVIGATRAIVETVNSNTSITLNAAWSGSTYTGAAYIIAYRSALRHDVTRLSLLYARWQREGTHYITTTGQPDNSVGNDGWVAFDLAAKTFYQKVGGAWDSGTSFSGELTRSGTVAQANIAAWVNNTTIRAATNEEIATALTGSRLGVYAKTVTDWNSALQCGWYMGNAALNDPNTSGAGGPYGWYLGYVESHTALYHTQTVHFFTGDSEANTRVYRRSMNGTWSGWYQLQLSQAEQDARYARLSGATFTGPIRTPSYTVASLPNAGTSGAGARAFVTDANATTFASVVAGGGANGVPVYSDGTYWRIG